MARVAEAGLHNLTFMRSDVSQVTSGEPFDGVVGRCILQFLPDAAAVLRSPSRLIRPGGVLAFHEPTWSPLLLLTAQLPLWSACASLIRKTFQCSGANPDMELVLFRAFAEAGLPAPNMWMEIPIGGVIRSLQDGSTISCAVFARRCSSTIFPTKRWAISRRCGKG
jgi:SAM-dependent methyltransferase